jgi:hypothetical protein
MESDSLYFSRRAKEERAAATNAVHPTARHAHLQMADRYAELATAIRSSEHQAHETLAEVGR